jgi:hypothetical protein
VTQWIKTGMKETLDEMSSLLSKLAISSLNMFLFTDASVATFRLPQVSHEITCTLSPQSTEFLPHQVADVDTVGSENVRATI